MPSAFSTRACNDWSLERQGVKDERWETVLCFTSGEGLDRLAEERVRYSDTWTTFCLITQVLFFCTKKTADERRRRSRAEQQLLSPGSGRTSDRWERNLRVLVTSPGFWSAVVLCLCCWAAEACHWGWGRLAWAVGDASTQRL